MRHDELHQSAYTALQSHNFELARNHYLELAVDGSPSAWTSLGWMYERAAGVKKSAYEAKQCYSKAIALGYLPAKFYLARLLIQEKEYGKAVLLLSAAADAGHVPSMYWIGRLLLTGRGIDKDAPKAKHYLMQAMEKGHIYARRDYHRCRLAGVFGSRRVTDIFGWVSALAAGVKLAASDPNSEFLQ